MFGLSMFATAADLAYGLLGLAFLVLFVGTVVVNWLKGKRLWAVLGFPTGWHMIPAFRLAKPDSWWARKYYGPEKLARANARFPKHSVDIPDQRSEAFAGDARWAAPEQP